MDFKKMVEGTSSFVSPLEINNRMYFKKMAEGKEIQKSELQFVVQDAVIIA